MGKTKEKKVRELKMPKRCRHKDFFKETGTRFELGTAKQLAFELVLNWVKEGKTIKEMRALIGLCRKENKYPYDLDAGYVTFVLASHPEFFKVYTDGTVELLKEPKADINTIEYIQKRKYEELRSIARRAREIRKQKLDKAIKELNKEKSKKENKKSDKKVKTNNKNSKKKTVKKKITKKSSNKKAVKKDK